MFRTWLGRIIGDYGSLDHAREYARNNSDPDYDPFADVPRWMLIIYRIFLPSLYHRYRHNPQAADPPLTEAESDETRRTYARLPDGRLEELLHERNELRPGAEKLLREELERRASQ